MQRRRIITLILAFLLLFMQQAERSHALVHIGEWLHDAQDRAVALPHSELPCAICALFAGGSTAAIDSGSSIPPPFVGVAVPLFEHASRPVAAPSYYASRAPPAFL